MKILMLGWEFPPSITGGLGIASHGIAESMAKKGHDITFLLPKKIKTQQSTQVKLVDASTMKVEQEFWVKTTESITEIQDSELGSQVVAYMPPKIYRKLSTIVKFEKKKQYTEVPDSPLTGKYDEGLLHETGKFALLAVQQASSKKYDLVYCHDWPTFKAGRLVKEMLGIKLAVHIHSTEFERNGVFTDPTVIQEEGKGIRAANYIFSVSEVTKNIIADNYAVKKNKITVAPNAGPLISFKPSALKKKKPIVAFIGRFTDQKSPGTFIDIARELTSRGRDYEFVMIGDGYLYNDLIAKCNELNMADRLTLSGFINHQKVLGMMSKIDLLIAPSNSEPFGLVMLEAILQNVAVLSAPGSGLSEFIPELPQSDRWDIYNSTSLAERLIEDKAYRKEIVEKCLKSAKKLSWDKTASIITDKISQ
ncbi:MAG: glycosyltransferase family 4 protein [Bacteroidota bacterium]